MKLWNCFSNVWKDNIPANHVVQVLSEVFMGAETLDQYINITN